MANLWQASLQLAAASANNIAQSQSPGAGAITMNGSAVSGGVATLDVARRILFTSGTSDAGITFTVTGTNASGAPLTETIQGGVTTAATTQDFKTVTSITHSGSVAGTLTVGTNGVAATPWFYCNREESNSLYGIAVVVGATMNYTIQHTLDDPNAPFTGTFPTVFDIGTATGTSGYATLSTPTTALRVQINSGTNSLKVIILQEGEGHV